MPIPNVTGAWLEHEDPGDRKFIKIGFLLLESGETLPDITIAYQTWGKLNANKDNAILVNHAWTGWSDVPSWWPSMVGPGLPLDTNDRLIAALQWITPAQVQSVAARYFGDDALTVAHLLPQARAGAGQRKPALPLRHGGGER